MSQQDKSRMYKALQDAGVQFSKHYREYTEAELEVAYAELQRGLEEQANAGPSPEPPPLPIEDGEELPSLAEIEAMHRPDPEPVNPRDPGSDDGDDFPAPPPFDPAKLREAAAAFSTSQLRLGPVAEQTLTPPEPIPLKERDPDEVAGARLNTKPLDEPIRTDEQGRIWYQEEVLKPAFPKPRGRRVLTYQDRGTQQYTPPAEGEQRFTETFEVPGNGPLRDVQVKITLPSYQVGIYKDRRFPFKVHTYNGVQGFSLFEVQDYYGGAELVPAGIKRVYVENVLCYDVRTTIRAIQEEFRQLQLAGRIKL